MSENSWYLRNLNYICLAKCKTRLGDKTRFLKSKTMEMAKDEGIIFRGGRNLKASRSSPHEPATFSGSSIASDPENRGRLLL